MSTSAASRPSKILRVARSDEKEQNLSVILHIQPTAATIPLNVTVTATDGSDGYGLTLKDSKVKALKDASSEQSDDEWKSVLRAVLLADAQPEDLYWLGCIELTAMVKKDGISVSIREDVGGIRRRLGILSLAPDDVEIELWDWLDTVCKEKGDAEERCQKAERAAADAQAKLEKLERQLQELSTAKKKHEDALILRFQHLLNEKKKKIRQLSTGGSYSAIAAPTSDANEEEEGEEEEEEEAVEIAQPTRKGAKISKISKTITGKKRKQVEKEPSDDSMADEEDIEGLSPSDKMDVVDPDAEDRQTTDEEATLGDTTDDDDEEL
ncbi:hypothetical protein ABW19_dt0205190 [Dactylella cylindrospora]|nr:hypothetical protein ABW19_dt0205190 [Dactylella cylindrospora]